MTDKSFKLEQVLKYRSDIERMRKHEFASAKRDLEHASERLKMEEDKVAELSNQFTIRNKELENIDDMRMYADFFARKRKEIKNHKEQVDILGRVMDDRRDILLDASKEKKVIESLKDKKIKEVKQEIAHKEQDFMDEISVQKKGK